MPILYLVLLFENISIFTLSSPFLLPAIFSTWLYHFAFFFLIVFFLMVFIIK